MEGGRARPKDSFAYAPTARAGCKAKRCGRAVGKGSLRATRFVKSWHHEGFDAHHYHFGCYAKLQKRMLPSSFDDVDDSWRVRRSITDFKLCRGGDGCRDDSFACRGLTVSCVFAGASME